MSDLITLQNAEKGIFQILSQNKSGVTVTKLWTWAVQNGPLKYGLLDFGRKLCTSPDGAACQSLYFRTRHWPY